MPATSQNDDYSWLGWLVGIVIIVWLIFVLSSSSDTSTKNHAIDRFLDDIDSKYSDLAEDAQSLVGDIDQECWWLDVNIGGNVGDYCSNSVNKYYAEINDAGYWTADSITYDESASLEDILYDIANQANSAYNDLLLKAQESEELFYEECGWLADNVSETVGDDCRDSISGLGDCSSDPFHASYYY